MSEPIKVEVGQVWERSGETITVYGISVDDAIVCKAGEPDSGGFVHRGLGCCWYSIDTLREGRLISPAPQPAHGRTGCAEWCGLDSLDYRVPCGLGDTGGWFVLPYAEKFGEHAGKAWCSPACRDARLPPLESKPSHVCKAPAWCGVLGKECGDRHRAYMRDPRVPKEFASIKRRIAGVSDTAYYCSEVCASKPPVGVPGGRGDCVCTPGNTCVNHAPAATPAKAKEPVSVCLECDKTGPSLAWRVTRDGREFLCDICMLRQEEQIQDLAGLVRRPHRARPGLLPKPRMAVDWTWDCLEDA